MAVTQSPEFKTAVEESRKLKAKPTNDELLQLYGLFKTGSQDPPLAESTKPGMFDITGKAKRMAWEKIENEGTTPEEAQKKYVELVNSLKEKYGFEG